MIIIKGTQPLEVYDIDTLAPGRCSDMVELKLFLGREIDGLTCGVPVAAILEMPQVWPVTWRYWANGKLN